MPTLDSSGQFLSGVPLGGIGAGKLEILPTGVWSAFTFLNNWTAPISGKADYPGVLGFHLGISVKAGGRRKSFLLQTVPLPGAPAVRAIRYEGTFPEAVLVFKDPRLGVECTLRAAGSFVPGQADASALPGVRLTLSVRNPSKKPVEVSLFFAGRNVLGEWSVGRRNRVEESADWLHLDFSRQDSKRDARSGRLLFSFSKKGWETSFWESWNAVKENFRLDAQAIRLDGWEEFSRTGRLPNRRGSEEAHSENREWCSAASARTILSPKGEREWFWTAAWHVPHPHDPSRYERLFRSPEGTHRALVSRRRSLERSTRAFHETVRSLPFPAWFNDALLNNLYPFFSSSRFTADGHFAFYEAPVVCPLVGTLDVGFYGSIPLAYFFPELSKTLLRQFSRAQRRSGYIPHDLGRDRFDRASDGTTPFAWKDLNPKYVLMVWRDFVWSGDKRFLRDLYPSVRRALEWTAGADSDGDGLPDHEGADQTFDLWDMRGANSYTSSLYLAALLAGERMAETLGDAEFVRLCRTRFKESSFSFERKLWTGRYFGPTCSIAQLAGQWYADLLGLGSITQDGKIQQAIETVRVWNARSTRFGWVNSTLEGGKRDVSSNHARHVWFGMNYAFVSLALLRGYPMKIMLKPLERLWDNLLWRQRNPWSQPDMLDARTGSSLFGDSYYRNMAIWSIPLAWARRDKRTARLVTRLRHLSTGRDA